MKWLAYSKIIFLSVSLMGFCTVLHAQERGSTHPETDTVILQLKWFHQFQFAGYYAADIKGFYEQEGLNVKILEGGPSIRAVDVVLSGEADLGIFDTELLVNYANGEPVVALDAFFQSSPVAIAVKKSSSVNSLAKLSESVIMIHSSIGMTELEATLINEGISIDSLKLYQGEYSHEEFVRNDAIDAIHAYYTVDIPKMERDGLELDVILPSMYGVSFYGDILFTSNQFLNSSSDAVQKFRSATKKGWEYARNNQDEIIEYITQLPGVKERGMSREVLTIEANRTWQISIPNVVPYGYMNPERWNKIAEYYSLTGLIPSNLNLDKFLITHEQTLLERLLPVLKYVIIGLVFIAISSGLWLYILRKQVKRSTQLWVSEFKERQKTSKELELKKRDYKALVENIRECVFSLKPDGVFTYVSPTIEKITGYTSKEIVGAEYAPFFSEEIRTVLFDRLKARIETDIDDNAIIKINHKNGSTRWVSASTKVFRDPTDGVVIQGTFNDETERIRTQKALEEQEERFRMMTEKSFTGFVLFQDDKVRYINQRYCEILGLHKEELRTTEDLYKRTHPEDIDKVKQSVQDRKDGKTDYLHYQTRMLHSNGSIIYLDVYGSVATVNDQQAIMASVMDITESIEIRKNLESSITEKNVLLAEIHHRVKNNMAVVSGLMDLQKFKTKDKMVHSILSESQLRIKTIAMIHEKLYQSESFSEIPFGQYLSELISSISDSLYQESSNIKVLEEYDSLSLNINQAIPAALFVNEVITNCFKHAFPDKKEGAVSIEVKNNPNNHVLIRISDNGKGLPENFGENGSLGITLIKNLSLQIDGKLNITSGSGTCFEIDFIKEDISGSTNTIL